MRTAQEARQDTSGHRDIQERPAAAGSVVAVVVPHQAVVVPADTVARTSAEPETADMGQTVPKALVAARIPLGAGEAVAARAVVARPVMLPLTKR